MEVLWKEVCHACIPKGISRLRDSVKGLIIPVSRLLVISRYAASW